jgi:hypothetical protein
MNGDAALKMALAKLALNALKMRMALMYSFVTLGQFCGCLGWLEVAIYHLQ